MSEDLARLREELVAKAQPSDPRVLDALREVPRHLFLPGVPLDEVYADEAIVTKRDGDGLPVSSSSQPALMTLMLEQLDLRPGHRVLEIGAGTGYNAALIAHIVGPDGLVVTVDLDEDITEAAREHLAEAGFPQVVVHTGDGADGCPAYARYDRIIATVALADLPPAWLTQAAPAALIVVPLDLGACQVLVTLGERQGHWPSRAVSPCGFIRMRGVLADPAAMVVLGNRATMHLPPAYPAEQARSLADAMAGSAAAAPTGLTITAADPLWGLGLWLTTTDPRMTELIEEDGPWQPLLPEPVLRSKKFRVTYGIVDEQSIAVLTRGDADITALGFGADGPRLAAELAAHVSAWDAAGRPAAAGLHVDAYPRPAEPPSAGTLIVERQWTRFAVYRVL